MGDLNAATARRASMLRSDRAVCRCPSARRWTRPGERTNARRKDVVLTVDPLSGFPLSVLRSSNWHCSNPGISERSDQMRIRAIAAALVVAAPLLALGSPQAAACWGTGYGYGATTAARPIAPRRGYMSYGYSSPAYYGGIGIRRVGYYRGVGLRSGYGYRGIGVGRVGVGRIGLRR